MNCHQIKLFIFGLVIIGDDGELITFFNARTCQTVATLAHANLTTNIRGLTRINSTTYAALSNEKVAFISTDTQLILSYFDTGHTYEVMDMTYLKSTSGEEVIVTCSYDSTCKGKQTPQLFSNIKIKD